MCDPGGEMGLEDSVVTTSCVIYVYFGGCGSQCSSPEALLPNPESNRPRLPTQC